MRAVILHQQQMYWICEHWNGASHSFMCMSLRCTICTRVQPEDRFISVQYWALVHFFRPYLVCYFSVFVFIFLPSVSLLAAYHFVCIYHILFVCLLEICMNAVICRLSNPLRRGHSCQLSSVAGIMLVFKTTQR